MKIIFILMNFLLLPAAIALDNTNAPLQDNPIIKGCGIKPYPEGGCKIGKCVEGKWEMICETTTVLPCGIKPVAGLGCRIGDCVSGRWQ